MAASADLAAAPSAPDSTEAIQLKDENKQPAADAERRDISGTRGHPISEASQVATFTEAAEQPSAPDPTEVIQLKDENEQRAAMRNVAASVERRANRYPKRGK